MLRAAEATTILTATHRYVCAAPVHGSSAHPLFSTSRLPPQFSVLLRELLHIPQYGRIEFKAEFS